MVTLLSGPDIYRSFARLQELITGRPYQRVELHEKTDLDHALGQGSLFGDALIVISDSGEPEIDRRTMAASIARTKNELIIREPANRWAVLLKGPAIKQELFPLLSGSDLEAAVRKLLTEYEVTMSSALTSSLCRSIKQLAVLEATLASWTGQTVTQAMVDAVSKPADRQAVFTFLDALFGKKPETKQLLEGLRASGEADLYLLSMVHWQLKTLLLVASGATGSLKPYTITKAKQLLGQWEPAQLLYWSDRTVALDQQLKSGGTVPEVALDYFVLDLLTS